MCRQTSFEISGLIIIIANLIVEFGLCLFVIEENFAIASGVP